MSKHFSFVNFNGNELNLVNSFVCSLIFVNFGESWL